ncbi:unnamed protein product, partial [Symbiodinium sp. CCMP2456]
MAAATFVVRPLLMVAKGWTVEQKSAQTRDSVTAAVLMFLVSLAVMASATGALYYQGKSIQQVMDMVQALQPAAGSFAMALFFAGALSAGLSSLFPIMMAAPLLIADYRNGTMETNTPLFRVLCAVACLVGLIVPILGFNPIQAQIVSQIGGVFVLPVSIAAMAYLVNRRDLMHQHKAGLWLNLGMGTAFLFSLLITYTGCLAIASQFEVVPTDSRGLFTHPWQLELPDHRQPFPMPLGSTSETFPMHRRTFLAASSAAVLLSSSLRAEDSSRRRVAVIGHSGRGNYGHGLDTVWRNVPETETVAVADADQGGLAREVEKLKLDRGYADYRQMLLEVRPEFVAVGPRHPDQHLDMIMASI